MDFMCVSSKKWMYSHTGIIRRMLDAYTRFMVHLPDENDLETWMITREEGKHSYSSFVEYRFTGNHSVYFDAIDHFNNFIKSIGQNLTLEHMTGVIKENIQSECWVSRYFSYFFLGSITCVCNKAFIENIAEVVQLAASGVVDHHVRVRYASIECLGLLMDKLFPEVQRKYHSEIMPKLLEICEAEK